MSLIIEARTWTDGLFEYMSDHGIVAKELDKVRLFLEQQQFDSDCIQTEAQSFQAQIPLNRRSNSNIIKYLNNDHRKFMIICEYYNDATGWSVLT